MSHAKSLRGWRGSIGCRMMEEGWEGGEEKSHCPLILLILVMVLHEVPFTGLAAAPAQELPPVYKTDFPVPLCDCHASCGPALVAVCVPGLCPSPWALQVEPHPHSHQCSLGRGATCRVEAVIAVKGVAVPQQDGCHWEKGKKTQKTSFGKIFIKQYLLWELLSVRCKCIFLSFLQRFWAASLITDLFGRLTRWEPAL